MAMVSKLEDLFVSTITNSPAEILLLPQSFPRKFFYPIESNFALNGRFPKTAVVAYPGMHHFFSIAIVAGAVVALRNL